MAASLLRRRSILLAIGGEPPAPPAPYDAVVQYVDCNGTYVDTGVVIYDHTIVAEMKFSQGYKDNACLFGVWEDTSPSDIMAITLYANRYYFGVGNGELSVAPVQPFDTNWHTYTLSCRGLLQIDSDVLYNTPKAANDTTCPCFVFARNYMKNGQEGPDSYKAIFPAGCYCRSFKIINNATGVPVFDGKSVRVGSIGYLYDSVSGNLFAGHGANLIPGNDV